MDNLFKALLIIILVAFLYLYYQNSEVGRYSRHGEGRLMVLDTKTGKLYVYSLQKDKITLYDLPNETIKERDVNEEVEFHEYKEQ